MRRFFLIILFTILITSIGYSIQTKNLPKGNTYASNTYWLDVGDEQYALGPTCCAIDNPFFTATTSASVQGYTANASTYLVTNPLTTPSYNQNSPILTKGPAGNFDECGAWLQSVYQVDSSHWLGWYHAEHSCNYAQGITYKSMAFAESFDGGLTWTKTNYPNNQVLTPYDPSVNEGDGHVTRIGDYLYMFFLSYADWKIHLARSLVSDQGRPGTWYKYYNGAFTEPGIGGNSTALTGNLTNGFVVYNNFLNQYISIFATGKWGFSLNFTPTTDFTNWSTNNQTIYPLVSTPDDPRVDDWAQASGSASLELYGYPSIIDTSGNSDVVGQSFYLYYMKLFRGQGFTNRYLMRRKITAKNLSPLPSYSSRVALTSYTNASGKIKISTEIAKPSEGYTKNNNIGYISPYAQTGFTPLYECITPSTQTYFMSISDPSVYQWTHCESTSDTFIRTIGWIAPSPQNEYKTALYKNGLSGGALLGYMIQIDAAIGSTCTNDGTLPCEPGLECSIPFSCYQRDSGTCVNPLCPWSKTYTCPSGPTPTPTPTPVHKCM